MALFDSAGAATGIFAVSGSFTVSDGATATVTDVLTLTHNTSGTPAASYGTGILFRGQDDAKTAGGDDYARIQAKLLTATAGAEITGVDFLTRAGGGALTTIMSLIDHGTTREMRLLNSTVSLGLQATSGGAFFGTTSNHSWTLIANNASQITVTTTGFTFPDAKNIALGSTTGTKIGTAPTQLLGFFNHAPVAQQTGSGWTNNITSGGTTDQLDTWSNLSTYGTDAAAIRNAVYQCGLKIAQINTALRNLGLLS